MRRFGWSIALTAAFALGLIGPALAANEAQPASPEPEKIAVTMSVRPQETREYKVDAVVKGKIVVPDSPELRDVDAAFSLKIRHQYGRRENDGLLPLDISLLEGQFTAQDQKIEITPSLYPKLTVLIDREWRINDIFGLPSAEISQTLPGINYGNHIILFFPLGLAQPRAPGETWEWTVNIPNYGESYKFANTLKGVEDVNGVKAAVLRQEITRLPKEDVQTAAASMKATAESAFSLSEGKLLKSHVECEVSFPTSKSDAKTTSKQDLPSPRANIKIDISLVK